MRLVTFEHEGGTRLGVVQGDWVIAPAVGGAQDLPADMPGLIDGGSAALQRLAAAVREAPAAARRPLVSTRLLAPIPRPRQNIMCLGWNYLEHLQEADRALSRRTDTPEHPVVFTKSVFSVNAPHGDIPFDSGFSTQMDWEVELAVIIGRGGYAIPPETALDHVFGYTIVNDISIRDVQMRHKQFFLGKSADGCCPMGPWIVTADEIPDPQNLDLRCSVNGVLKQSGNTGQQIFNIASTIAILSRGMRLRPGDVIATGTPSGVGFARKPPEFLAPGDVVECEIERIGRISNRVVERPRA